MAIEIYLTDTFASPACKGNPTAVCVYEKMDDDAMQSMATELNVPVTAFIQRDAPPPHPIKYFTVTTEIPACGHATLAAASVQMKRSSSSRADFVTVNNTVISTAAEGDVVMMRYPKYTLQDFDVTKEILESLYLPAFINAGFSPELETLFIETEPAVLRSIQPNFARLTQSSNIIKEVVITSVSDDPQYDYLLRSFCPWIGIDEDPVTGSVHAVLAGYWKERLNKSRLKAHQASELGGELYVHALADATGIGGRTVFRKSYIAS
ncbi:MAG TPA: PhzF family phenazine biosynthesis protein [Chitinophagaceae bacterium]|nr:PhzF family phenazine biosynthesis protein [Chitinophagaceae bacterium]